MFGTHENAELWLLMFAVAFSMISAVIDVRTGRIPNRLTYSGIIIAVLSRTAIFGWKGLLSAVGGGLLTGIVFLLFYLVRVMGAGDVKLMTVMGCFAGPAKGIEIMLACAIFGGLMALFYMIYLKRIRRTVANLVSLIRFHYLFGFEQHPDLNLSNPTSVRLPYGAAIAGGALYSLCMTALGR